MRFGIRIHAVAEEWSVIGRLSEPERRRGTGERFEWTTVTGEREREERGETERKREREREEACACRI